MKEPVVLIDRNWIDEVRPLSDKDPGRFLELIAFCLGCGFGEFQIPSGLEDPELDAIWRHTKVTPVNGNRAGRIVWLKRGRRNGK